MSAPTNAYRLAFRSGGEKRIFTFPRSRRLKSRRLIQSLFERARNESRMLSAGAIRILYRRVSLSETCQQTEAVPRTPVQIGFAVGRSAGNAVRRNRIKRLLREEYRLNRTRIEKALNQPETRVVMMVVLRNNRATPEELRDGFRHALSKLAERENSPSPAASRDSE